MIIRILGCLVFAAACTLTNLANAQTPAFGAAITTEAGAQEAKAEKLGDTSIKARVTGQAATGTMPNGREVAVSWRADGTNTISGAVSDDGDWRIQDGRLCHKWKKIRNGAESCATLYSLRDRIYAFNPDGSLNGVYSAFKPN